MIILVLILNTQTNQADLSVHDHIALDAALNLYALIHPVASSFLDHNAYSVVATI